MRRLLFFLILFFFSNLLYATHNRSGEITFRQISFLTYEIKIVTYTKTSSPADRPKLGINWGDHTSDSLSRTGSGTPLEGDIKRNEYIGVHTYPGADTYKINFEDPNRDAGVKNISTPQVPSDKIPFYIETYLNINSFYKFNNSPVLLQPPIDQGATFQRFVHNPNAYDPDGDSLSYQLVPCRGAGGDTIPSFKLPNASNGIFTIDAVTGDLVWDAPTEIGEFNVAIKIKEWRRFDNNGKRLSQAYQIGYVIRDLQIEIFPSTNRPPKLAVVQDTCVTAGDSLNFNISATDIDNDKINLFATGGTFNLNPTSVFTQTVNNSGFAQGRFKWKTDCSHIRQQPYQVVFKAEDVGAAVALVDLKSMRIRVVPPAPKNLTAQASGNVININWEKEFCTQALGYKIYRKDGPSGFSPSVCETGLPASTGFVLIDQIVGINNVSYTDSDKGAGLIHGIQYCYRVVAYFADGVESYASNEDCDELKKDVPVMTLASVLKTDSDSGKVSLRWSKPIADILDTNANPKPYMFELYRKGVVLPIKVITSQSFVHLTDTTYIDSLVNTVDTSNAYFVKFYTKGTDLKGTTTSASTIFLSISPTDNRLNLSWQSSTPWKDSLYYIYKKISGAFVKIDSTIQHQYSDTGLVNGTSYCYLIEGKGRLSGLGFPNPIVNRSQEQCEIPVDNIPPCAPKLEVKSECEKFRNNLTWNNPNLTCSDDVLTYRLYRIKSRKEPWTQEFDSVSPATSTQYLHDNLIESVAGCYSITAVDSAGNESVRSNIICVDNCPRFALPNLFTPNDDQINDFFRPLSNSRFIERINIKIFDRWGVLMFETDDPKINWDGKNKRNEKDCEDGTYFYVCEVYELLLDDVNKRTITGFVELMRGKKNPQLNK